MTLSEYVSCMLANRYTRIGSEMAGLAAILGIADHIGALDIPNLVHLIPAGLSLSFLQASNYGQQTYKSLKSIQRKLKENTKLSLDHVDSHTEFYCNKVGVKLALKNISEDRYDPKIEYWIDTRII